MTSEQKKITQETDKAREIFYEKVEKFKIKKESLEKEEAELQKEQKNRINQMLSQISTEDYAELETQVTIKPIMTSEQKKITQETDEARAIFYEKVEKFKIKMESLEKEEAELQKEQKNRINQMLSQHKLNQMLFQLSTEDYAELETQVLTNRSWK